MKKQRGDAETLLVALIVCTVGLIGIGIASCKTGRTDALREVNHLPEKAIVTYIDGREIGVWIENDEPHAKFLVPKAGAR